MMRCPPAIESVLLELIRTGILHVRSAAWGGDAELAADLADHVHNLPGLISDFSPDALASYWEVERPEFAAHVAPEHAAPYKELWNRLDAAMDRLATAQRA